MKLIILSYPDFFDNEIDILISLMQSYDFLFHLRKPCASEEQYNSYLQAIPNEFHHRIVLHDAFNLCNIYNLHGIHFSTKNRHLANQISYSGTKSTSCHSLAEITKLDRAFTYAFLSPIFPSISKQGYSGTLNMTDIQTYLHTERIVEIIALGGVDGSKIDELRNMGFDGVAVLGSVWTSNPANISEISNNITQICRCLQ